MKSGNAITLENVSFKYPSFVIENIRLSIPKESFFGIIGPNGSGKTTVLSLIMKFLKPISGRIYVDGQDISKLSHKKIAQKIAYIAQDFNPAYDFTVEELVEMGGIARASSFFDTTVFEKDLEFALDTVDLLDYRKRVFSTLSGGQQRRVLIARAMYQNTPIIIADELVTHLDLGQSVKVLNYLRKLTESGKTIIGTFHDISLAAKYCDQIAVMKDGKVIDIGSPKEIINEELIKKIYGINVRVVTHPDEKYPLILI